MPAPCRAAVDDRGPYEPTAPRATRPMPAGLTREERVDFYAARAARGEPVFPDDPSFDAVLSDRQGFLAAPSDAHIATPGKLVEQRHDGLHDAASFRRRPRAARPCEAPGVRRSEAARKRAARRARRVQTLMKTGLTRRDAERKASEERDLRAANAAER